MLTARIAQWVSHAVTFDQTDVTFDDTSLPWDGRAGVYTRTLDADIRAVEGVEEDGVALTEVASAALVDTTLGSWFFTPTTRTLRIHTTDNGAAAAKALLVLLLEPLAIGRGLVKTRNGIPLAWAPRVLALPTVSQAIDTSRLGAIAAASYGQLVLDNADGRYDSRLGSRSFRELRVLRGDEDAPYSAFVLRDRALLDEPSFSDLDTLTVPVRSYLGLLDTAICTDSYTASAYPDMDPQIAGTNIRKVFGPVVNAVAQRIASGRWKVSALAMTTITAVAKTDGTAVSVLTTSLSAGEFTVDPALDTETLLHVTGTGVDVSLIGDMIGALLADAAIPAAQIDPPALSRLNVDRPVHEGFSVAGGSYRDVLDGLATSAFVDVMVTRAGVFTARVRRADWGNLIPEAPTWKVRHGATLDLAPATTFGGSACIAITKPAGEPLAHAYLSNLPLIAGKAYTFTLVAAPVTGATAAFRLSTTDSDGNEYFSDPITLTTGAFIRVTGRTRPLQSDVIFFDATSVRFDSETVTFAAEGGELRIYPQHDGSDEVTVLISAAELVDAIQVDDRVGTPTAGGRRGPVLWRVLAPCAFDGRTQTRRAGTRQDSAVRRQFPLAKSESLPVPAFDGGLVALADGTVAAQAGFTYFSEGRMGFELELPNLALAIDLGTVLEVATSRRPRTPADSPLFRVTSFTQEELEDGAACHVTVESQFDPTADLTTITPT